MGTIVDVNDTTTMNGDYSTTVNLGEYIPMVAAGNRHTMGPKDDGTLVTARCAGRFDDSGQCDVGGRVSN